MELEANRIVCEDRDKFFSLPSLFISCTKFLLNDMYTIKMKRKYLFVCIETAPKLQDNIKKLFYHWNPTLPLINIGCI